MGQNHSSSSKRKHSGRRTLVEMQCITLSIPTDLRSIKNEYELIVRMSKVLEQIFLQYFSYEQERTLSRQIHRLEEDLKRSNKHLRLMLQRRNQLIHDPSVKSLKDLGTCKEDLINCFMAALQIPRSRPVEMKRGETQKRLDDSLLRPNSGARIPPSSHNM